MTPLQVFVVSCSCNMISTSFSLIPRPTTLQVFVVSCSCRPALANSTNMKLPLWLCKLLVLIGVLMYMLHVSGFVVRKPSTGEIIARKPAKQIVLPMSTKMLYYIFTRGLKGSLGSRLMLQQNRIVIESIVIACSLPCIISFRRPYRLDYFISVQ